LNLLIDIETASKFFKVSIVTIYRWIREDKIKKRNQKYLFVDLEKAYGRRHRPKPRLPI